MGLLVPGAGGLCRSFQGFPIPIGLCRSPGRGFHQGLGVDEVLADVEPCVKADEVVRVGVCFFQFLLLPRAGRSCGRFVWLAGGAAPLFGRRVGGSGSYPDFPEGLVYQGIVADPAGDVVQDIGCLLGILGFLAVAGEEFVLLVVVKSIFVLCFCSLLLMVWSAAREHQQRRSCLD